MTLSDQTPSFKATLYTYLRPEYTGSVHRALCIHCTAQPIFWSAAPQFGVDLAVTNNRLSYSTFILINFNSERHSTKDQSLRCSFETAISQLTAFLFQLYRVVQNVRAVCSSGQHPGRSAERSIVISVQAYLCPSIRIIQAYCTGCSKKTDPLVYFDDNFGKYGPILTSFSLLQQEIYNAQKLSYFSHHTFIMLPLYLAKQTLMLVSMQIFLDHAAKQISMYCSGCTDPER